MNIKIVRDKIDQPELLELAEEFYVEMIKGVVDLERGIIALGGEWHMDANEILIKDGSNQEQLWGFNIYLNKDRDSRLEYTSLINIRPGRNNLTMEVGDEKIRQQMKTVIDKLVE